MERVADYIIRKICEMGTKKIFLISGRGILYLTDAVARNNLAEHICTYHEQGISFAAMAYAQASGGVGACLVSTGCAATNAITACLCAFQDNIPVVFVSGNNPLLENKRHTGKNIRTYGSQETDIISIVEPITKYAVMLEDKADIVYQVEKALYIVGEGRKGPVWIDVPLDVQDIRIDESIEQHYRPEKPVAADGGGLSEIKGIQNSIRGAQRPILLIGGGARGAAAEVKRFVEQNRIPLVYSPTACDLYGSRNLLSIGAVGSIGGSRAGNFAVQNADFILAIGSKLSSQLTGMKHAFARNARITAVDIDKNEHLKAGVHIDNVINQDAGCVLNELLRDEIKPSDPGWINRCLKWKDMFSVKEEAFLKELETADLIDLYSLSLFLSDVIPKNATVVADAGFEELVIPAAMKFREGQRCLFPASQGAMGYAIPAVIGAYHAGRKNIICIVGDGSIMMNMQELYTIKASQIPVTIIVINNNMYAVIRKRQKDLFRSRTIGNDPSDGVPEPDFGKIADSIGMDYYYIQSWEDMVRRLGKLVSNEGSQMIEVRCTPDQEYLHESYALNEKGRLVHRPIEDMAPFLGRDVIRQEMVVPIMSESE